MTMTENMLRVSNAPSMMTTTTSPTRSICTIEGQHLPGQMKRGALAVVDAWRIAGPGFDLLGFSLEPPHCQSRSEDRQESIGMQDDGGP